MAEQAIIIILQLSLLGLGGLFMFILQKNADKEKAQREKDRELEREQREKDRELEREQREKSLTLGLHESELNREQERYFRQLERNLHEDRMRVYFEILEPYIYGLSNRNLRSNNKNYKGKNGLEIMTEIMSSLDYQEVANRLTLIGSDEVVKAHAELRQYYYRKGQEQTQAALEALKNGKAVEHFNESTHTKKTEELFEQMQLLGNLYLV